MYVQPSHLEQCQKSAFEIVQFNAILASSRMMTIYVQ